MSEEIIIDNVNVAECSYYSSETYPYTCEVWDNECEAQNCYYKQLKRLQAENEELKKIIKTQNPWHNCKNCNKDYKQALEEIRELNLFSLNNSREKIAKINEIVSEVLK